MLGVVVPKIFYNSCPLKHEVVNLLMSGEMLYHEDLKFFQDASHLLCVFRWDAMHFDHGAGEMVQF